MIGSLLLTAVTQKKTQWISSARFALRFLFEIEKIAAECLYVSALLIHFWTAALGAINFVGAK